MSRPPVFDLQSSEPSEFEFCSVTIDYVLEINLRPILNERGQVMARESKRIVSEAGRGMHSRSKVERSLAGEVLRQSQKRKAKRSPARKSSR